MGWLNVGSLMLGLIAWALPVINFMQHKNQGQKHWAALSIMSIGACAVSLCFQIFYNYHLVKIEDWSALMDTIGAVAFAAAVLLTVTIVLNAISFIVYRNRTLNYSPLIRPYDLIEVGDSWEESLLDL